MTRAAVYVRVSTQNQTTENQKQELLRVAQARGWTISGIYEDRGISGTKRRELRPAYDSMLKDAVRSKFNVVMAWDVSRLGRSLSGLVTALEDLHQNGIDLYIHQQALDTTTPSGKALFQMCGVFAEFERGIISERIKAGLSRTKKAGTKLGRPKYQVNHSAEFNKALLSKTVREIASELNISVGKAHAIKKEVIQNQADLESR